jgi:hypothetical protein
LLYLRGVDVAIINSDSLEQFRAKVPDVQQKITYILSLFPSELHIMVRPEIKSLDDLKGKKVNFNTQGTAAAYSGPLIFDKLKLNEVQRTFIPHQVAMEQMKAGTDDMAAVVFVTSKPVDAFLKGRWPPGFHFLSVPMEDYSYYLPATLNSADYPAFIAKDQKIRTIAVPTILAAFNWPKGSNRYARVARLVDNLFGRLETLQGPGYHPKWKDVVLNAQVPGLARFSAAQEWLDRVGAIAQAGASLTTMSNRTLTNLRRSCGRSSCAGGRILITEEPHRICRLRPRPMMMRSDTSPVRDRIAELTKKGVVCSGCGNTRTNQPKWRTGK